MKDKMKVMGQGLILIFLVFALIFFGSFLTSCQKQNDQPLGTTVTDVDGNVYHTVMIGGQEWMVENLRVTHFNDGTEIPLVENQNLWDSLPTILSAGYCYYNNDESLKNSYGCLYNGYAIHGSKLAPFGFHIATNCDMIDLVNYLGGREVIGGKIKIAGTTYWKSPNVGATNESGLSVLPGGFRGDKFYGLGESTSIGIEGYTTDNLPTTFSAYYDNILTNYGNGSMATGLSVRCVRDKGIPVNDGAK